MIEENLPQSEFERVILGAAVEIGTAYYPDDTQAFPPHRGERDRVPFPAVGEVDLAGTTFAHNRTEIRRLSNGGLYEAARHRAKVVVAVLPN